MTRRKRRWLIAVLLVACAICVAAWMGYVRALPWVVRRQVNAVFERAGLGAVKFDVRRATLFGSDIADVSSKNSDLLDVNSVAVRYSPWDALSGQLESVTISGATITIDLDHLPQTQPSTDEAASAESDGGDLPLRRVDLVDSQLLLKRRGRSVALPLHGSLQRISPSAGEIELDSVVGGAPLAIRANMDLDAGRIDATAGVAGAQIAALATLLPDSPAKQIADIDGRFGASATYSRSADQQKSTLLFELKDASARTAPDPGATIAGANVSILLEQLVPHVLATSPQTVSIASIDIAKTRIDDLRLVFSIPAPQQIRVDELSARWAGGIVRVEPLAFDPLRGVIDATVVIEKVQLDPAVVLLTDGKGSATGAVSGRVSINIDPTRTPDVISIGQGVLRTESGGNLRLADATDGFETVLERSNPAFADDPEMAEVKQDILDAVRDFNYDLLDVTFTRDNGHDALKLRLHGRGRTGGRIPINLGLGIEGGSALLNDYLDLKSRVFSGATTKDSP